MELPRSPALGFTLVALAIVALHAVGFEEPVDAGQLTLEVAASVLFLVLVPVWVLILHGRRDRFPQTLMALAFVSLLGSVILLPLWWSAWPQDDASAWSWGPVISVLLLVLAWSLAAYTYIWKHVLDRSYVYAFNLVIGLLVAETAVHGLIYFLV